MTSSACPHCGGTSVVFTTEALGITREQGIARACKACAQVGIGPTTIEELCAMVDESINNPYPIEGESLREADRRIAAMDEADEWCCQDCADGTTEREARVYGSGAYDDRYLGGIDMTDPNDGPDKYIIPRR